MKFSSKNVAMQPEILKRKLGAEYTTPITLNFGDATEIKAGTPIAANGAVATTTEGVSNAVGILLVDANTENPNGTILKAYGVVNTANCPVVSSASVITSAVKAALPLIVFE